MNEKQLIEACLIGNRNAQKSFVEIYSGHIFSICLRYTGNEFQAKDFLQESLIQILKNLDKYQDKGHFKAWISRITMNKCIELLRKEKRRSWDDLETGYQAVIDENSSFKLEQDDVLRFISKMPANYRLALNMYLVEGYTHKEIAEFLGIKEGTSRSLVARGRKLIQNHFEDHDQMKVVYKQTPKDDKKKLNYLI